MSGMRERLSGWMPTGDGAPNPWGGLFIGFVLVTLTAAATAVMISLWAASRPVNLVPVTDTLIRMTVETLRAHDIPSSAIIMQPPVMHENPVAVWNRHEIRADLPPLQHTPAIVRELRAKLEPRHVTFHETITADGGIELRMDYGGVEFASLHLRGGRMDPERKRDFRAAAERVARQVERIVHERLPAEGQLAIMPVEPREDATTLWSHARFEAFVPDEPAMRDIQRAIEGAMTGREVTVEAEERAGGAERVIRLAFQRYPVVQLLLTPRPPRVLPEIQAPTMEMPPDPISVFDPGAILEPGANSETVPEGLPLRQGARTAPAPPTMQWTGPPRIALIIDDGGEEPAATEVILGLDRGLTFAILPDTTGGVELARRAAAMGFEIMLHMPMETENASQNYPNSLMIDTPAAEVARLVERARAQVPGAIGMNNHTGGAFTADAAAVERLMRYLATTPLYFVDSRTNADTVAFDVAREYGIPAAQRDIFLDNEPDFAYIEGRFNELTALAVKNGAAIGIAHFRPATAEALVTLLPRLEEAGIRLVPVSELLQ